MAIIDKSQANEYLVMKETDEDSPIFQNLRIGQLCHVEKPDILPPYIYTINPHTAEQVLICAEDSPYAIEYLAYNGDGLAEKRFRLLHSLLDNIKRLDLKRNDFECKNIVTKYYDNEWILVKLQKAPINDLLSMINGILI